LKILLVDDHKLLAQGLKNALLTYDKFERVDVIDYKLDLESILACIKEINYDLILLDINIKKILPIDGIDLCSNILKYDPNLKVIILTGYDFYALEKDAKSIGARAFLNKEMDIDDLFDSMMKVYKGELIFKLNENKYIDLTQKEEEIVRLYAKGLSRKEVASYLEISMRTLANHLQIIYEKLDVKNYQEMINKATSLGYVRDNLA